MRREVGNHLLSAVLTIAMGILFIVWKNQIISVAMTVFGVALIVFAVLDLLSERCSINARPCHSDGYRYRILPWRSLSIQYKSPCRT